MEPIKYNQELFDILKSLTSISKSVIIKKEDDKIVVRKTNEAVSVAYTINVPLDFFDFPANNEDVTFYDYNDFYQYFKSFSHPEIYIDNQKLTLKENTTKINYILSCPDDFIKKFPPVPKFGESDISFNLTSKDHEEIIKMITLIKPKKARVFGDSKTISIASHGDSKYDNVFEKTFETIPNTNTDKVDFYIDADIFSQLPSKKDYQVNIKSKGALKFSLLNSNINLDIITGSVEK